MSTNRLYLYDPETESAVCIAKGYTSGWASGSGFGGINDFFDNVLEFTGSFNEKVNTRLELKTEDNLPSECKII